MKISTIIAFVSLLTVSSNLFANQEAIDKGWDYFGKNNLTNARIQFKAALADEEVSAEAHLALSLLATIDQSEKKAFAEFLEFYKVAKEPMPYTLALWSTQSVMSGYGKKSKEKIAFLESIVASEEMDGIIKAMANGMLGSHHQSSTNSSKAKAYYDKIGSITSWQFVGEFDNVSGSGFDKDHDVLAHPAADYIFKNKIGAEVKWFPVTQSRADRWVDLTYHFYASNSIVYAQNFCNSPVDQEVQFRLGSSGSVKAWVNDELLFAESEERNNDLDTYIFTAKLNKGSNRILIMIGESELDRLNFMLRITDSGGNPIPDLSFATNKQPYKKGSGFKSNVIPVIAETYFEEKVASEPEKLINYILLAETYMRNDKTYEARKVVKKAQTIAPECSFLISQLIEIYARDGNRTELSKMLEKLKKDDPENPISLALFFDEALEREDYKEAEALNDKMQKIFGEDANVLGNKIQLASSNEEIEELLKLVDRGYSQFEEDYNFVLIKYLVESEVKKNKAGAAKIIKTYLKNNFSNDAVMLMARYYLSQGDVTKGIDYLSQLVENNPVAVGYLTQIADIYFQTGNYNTAIEYFEKCSTIAPYIGSIYGKLAASLSEQKKTNLAIQNYQTNLKYSPNDYEARKQLRKLEGKKPIFDYFDKPDVYKIFENAPGVTDYPEDNSVILVDHVQKVVYKGGGSEEKHIVLIKTLDAAGIDEWKEYYIPVYKNQSFLIEKAEILKKDGNKIQAEVNDNQVVFTGLEAGDAIHLSYRLENYYFGKLAKHFWDSHYFKLYYPVRSSKYSLLTDKNVTFNWTVSNNNLKPEITEVDNFKLQVWQRENVPSVKHEPYMPPLTEVEEVLHLSSFPDWDFISKWYSDLSKTKAKVDFEVKEVVEDLMKDNKNYSAKKKVKLIYDYIVHNIRYSSVPFLQGPIVPQKASDVINTRIGDCKDVSTLFVAMCEEAGIPARLVLINTRDNGSKEMTLPSINFNHCIAKVNLNGDDYLVELTSDFLPFSSGYASIKNSFSLEVNDQPDQKIEAKVYDPPTRVKNYLFRTSKVSFNGSTMKVYKDNVRTGSLASSMRSSYRDIGKERQKKELQESISSDYATSRLNSFEFDDNLSNTSDSVTYRYEYEVDDIFTDISDLSIFGIPFSEKAAPVEFLSKAARTYPIDLWRYTIIEKGRETVTIDIPPGKSLSEIPKSVNYSNEIASYSLTFKQEGNQLIIDRILEYKNDIIPAEQYKNYKDFYAKVIKADETKLAFR